jgi:hypothetical protein
MDGTVTTDFGGSPGSPDTAVTLILQPDGKLVAAGVGGSDASVFDFGDFALVRYLPNGD